MKEVSLREKLEAQVKNIVTIVGSDNPKDVKIAMYEMQKSYLISILDDISTILKD